MGIIDKCVTCGKPIVAAPGRMYCPECAEERRRAASRRYYHRNREKFVQYSRERYRYLRSHNICVACGAADAAKDSVYCPQCREHAKAAMRRFKAKEKALDAGDVQGQGSFDTHIIADGGGFDNG